MNVKKLGLSPITRKKIPGNQVSGVNSKQYGVQNCNREKPTLSALITVILVFSFTTGDDKTHVFRVAKRLENGDALPAEKWSKFTIVCMDGKDINLTVETPHTNYTITVYFANEEKNILALNLTSFGLSGYKYETPYGKNSPVSQESEYKIGEGIITANITRKWFPHDVTRISASIDVNDDIYNYYGIFNRPISIRDTMVVEEFKKVQLC